MESMNFFLQHLEIHCGFGQTALIDS